jgi:hypothetical protein
MKNHTGDLALYADPRMTVEVIERLKATFPGDAGKTLEVLGSLTNRDLLFYSLGRITGIISIFRGSMVAESELTSLIYSRYVRKLRSEHH